MTKPIILPSSGLLSEAQQDCIDKLKEALRSAEKGEIYSLAMVLCMHDGYATTLAGTKAAELNMGCDSIKRQILERSEGRG